LVLQKLLWIALAGSLGALARYGFGGFVQKNAGGSFPWGTFAVNVTGCFLFGVVWSLAEERLLISSQTRTIVLVGFLGAFTTFSTYMFETGEFLRDSQWAFAVANIVLQNTVGIVCLFLGMAAGRVF
jgi:fluoride exporter